MNAETARSSPRTFLVLMFDVFRHDPGIFWRGIHHFGLHNVCARPRRAPDNRGSFLAKFFQCVLQFRKPTDFHVNGF